MKQEILIQKCQQHDLETIAFDMNPSANPSCRNCCIKCLKDPFKAQYCLSLKEARIHLLNVKKTFKQKKETQLKNNILILKELDKNISELKNMYVQTFGQIKESINHQIQQYQEYNSTLEQKLQSIDLDQYLSNTHDFATESLTNLGFKEKCLNLLESIFSQNSKDQFVSKLNELDDQSILFQSERNIEKNSQIKKKALLSFKCKKHGEEIRLYDEDESKIGEDKLMCDQCSVDRKGQFQTMVSLNKNWELYKNTQVKFIQDKYQQFGRKLRNNIQLLKDYQKELNIVINEIINTLEKEDNQQQNIYRSKISKLEQDWNTLNKEQLIKIINTINQPLLRENKIIKRQQKLEQKKDQLNSLLNNQLTLLISIIKKNLQEIMKSINYDYNLLKVIQQEELNLIEQESQTTQVTNSIQCQTVSNRFSNIKYINEFIMKLLNIEQQQKQQQGNEDLIKVQFNKIYSLFKLINQEKVQLKEFCNKMFIIIKKEFEKYHLQISNEEEKKIKQLKLILKNPQQCQKFLLPQEIIHEGLNISMFSFIKSTIQNYSFLQNFNKSIEERIVCSQKKQIPQFKTFYQWKITLTWISLIDFENYIEKEMIYELEAHCRDQNLSNIEQFLSWFTFLGFEIVKANVSELKETLNEWFQSVQKKRRLLRSCFKSNKSLQKITQASDFEQCIKNHCPHFLNYLHQSVEIIELIESNNLIEKYRNKDKIIFEIIKEVITIIDEKTLSQNTNSDKMKEPIYKTAEYIRANRSQENQMAFENYITAIIYALISDQGWKQNFIEIHDIILDEIKASNHFTIIENEQNINLTQYRRRQIQIIISKIEKQIKNLNLHLSNFGVIINQQGENFLKKCFLQYVIFVLWRFFCYEQLSKNMKIEQQQYHLNYWRFQANIQENKIEKSRYFGNLLAENIQLQTISKLYEKYSLSENIGNCIQEQSSFDLIKKLDNEILLGQDKNVTDEQKLEYITNQTNYILKYIRQQILNIKQKLTKQIKDDLILNLKQGQKNIKHLCEFDNYPQNIEDYFDQLIDPDQALDLLHQIVVNCLQGQINQQLLDMIKPEYRDKFKNKDFQIFTDQLCNYDQLDIQIHDLYTFTLAFQQKMDSIISELKDFQIDFQKLDIKQQLENIEMKLIGCLEQCPMCGRKCDSELYDKEHQHQCKNGHQLIAMNINNQNNFSSSLYSCEELQDDYIIFDLEKPINWKTIKAEYKQWIFSSPQIKEFKELQQKFTYLWNEKIGQMISQAICLQGRCVSFKKKRDFSFPTNYILMLDNCISRNLGNVLIPFLKTINNNPNNRITIILYADSESMCVVDQEPINAQEQIKKIDSIGLNQNKEPFLLAYDNIAKNFDKFKEHSIVICSYWEYYLYNFKQFKSIQAEKKKQIRIINCLHKGSNQIDFFKQWGYETLSKKQLKCKEIGQFLIETLAIQF